MSVPTYYDIIISSNVIHLNPIFLFLVDNYLTNPLPDWKTPGAPGASAPRITNPNSNLLGVWEFELRNQGPAGPSLQEMLQQHDNHQEFQGY